MKTNITRPVDREYGYDLEIETSVSRDGIACHGYINGDCKVVKFGPEAETEVRVHLYRAVTWELNNGARENLQPVAVNEHQCPQCGALSSDDCGCYVTYPSSSDIQFHHQTVSSIWDRIIGEDMQSVPATYAKLVEAREVAYIAQRDAENKLNDIKAALTASIASDPAYKNDVARKAELANRLQDYDTYVDQATKTADAYRKACNAIEVYQEQAKDARAKMRYETAQMELRTAELHLQVAQAKHDAQEPVDESPYGHFGDDKPMSYYNAVAADDEMPF